MMTKNLLTKLSIGVLFGGATLVAALFPLESFADEAAPPLACPSTGEIGPRSVTVDVNYNTGPCPSSDNLWTSFSKADQNAMITQAQTDYKKHANAGPKGYNPYNWSECDDDCTFTTTPSYPPQITPPQSVDSCDTNGWLNGWKHVKATFAFSESAYECTQTPPPPPPPPGAPPSTGSACNNPGLLICINDDARLYVRLPDGGIRQTDNHCGADSCYYSCTNTNGGSGPIHSEPAMNMACGGGTSGRSEGGAQGGTTGGWSANRKPSQPRAPISSAAGSANGKAAGTAGAGGGIGAGAALPPGTGKAGGAKPRKNFDFGNFAGTLQQIFPTTLAQNGPRCLEVPIGRRIGFGDAVAGRNVGNRDLIMDYEPDTRPPLDAPHTRGLVYTGSQNDVRARVTFGAGVPADLPLYLNVMSYDGARITRKVLNQRVTVGDPALNNPVVLRDRNGAPIRIDRRREDVRLIVSTDPLSEFWPTAPGMRRPAAPYLGSGEHPNCEVEDYPRLAGPGVQGGGGAPPPAEHHPPPQGGGAGGAAGSAGFSGQ